MTRYILTVVLALCAVALRAQDTHYWTQQYGARSALMSGAVVGGTRDTSACYYNPGALAFINVPSLSVSGSAYSVDTLLIDDGAGQGNDLKSRGVDVIPSLLSGIVTFEKHPKHVVGYSLLARQRFKASMSARRDTVLNALNDTPSPGTEEYIGQYIFDTNFSETWGGLTYAYRCAPGLALGATAFGVYRDHYATRTQYARAFNGTNSTWTTESITGTVDYYAISMLGKLGLAFDAGPVRIGLAVTTPGLNLFGRGTLNFDLTGNNFFDVGGGTTYSFVANDRQEHLRAAVRSPTAISGGAEWTIHDLVGSQRDTRVAFAIEWFSVVGKYDIIVPRSRDLVRPITVPKPQINSRNALRVHDEADAVMNFAFALEQDLPAGFKAAASLRTDISSQPASLSSAGISTWDMFHVVLGVSKTREQSEISVGFQYTLGGARNFEQPVNFDNPNDSSSLLGTGSKVAASYRAMTLIVGYTYYF